MQNVAEMICLFSMISEPELGRHEWLRLTQMVGDRNIWRLLYLPVRSLDLDDLKTRHRARFLIA